jgi:hypothetical protein
MTGAFQRTALKGVPATVALVAILLMLVAPAAASGPWIEVTSHEDGDHVTEETVTVSGTASEPAQTMELSGEDLVHATMSNVRWVRDNLTFRPDIVFEDEFGGLFLDRNKWTVVRDPANVSLEDGALKLDFTWGWPSPTSNMTLVTSKAFEIPEGVDYEVSYTMKFSQYGYSGAGGGVSDGPTDPWNSHLATLAYWAGGAPAVWIRVIADGEAYHNITGYNLEYHDYQTVYDAREERFECFFDAASLGHYSMDTTPDMFWFGHTEDVGYYDNRPIVMVDRVNVWATSGEWLSDVIDMGHHVELDGADLSWYSNHRAEAETTFEVRASADKVDWTEWVAVDDRGDLESPVNGTYIQLRLKLAVPGVYKENAHVTVTAIDLHYRNPLLSVEVRSQVTDWLPTEGTYQWTADVTLVENDNTVEVRATDTAGNVNLTTLELVLDTTPPVGTLAIAGDAEYRNDLNVTLLLNATDRYGVDWVDVSHFPDFSRKVRYPYGDSIEWRMSEIEGETFVYVRYVDGNGVMSEALAGSIFYDSIPPDAKVVIAGNDEWTGSETVSLALEYSDNVGVELVEVSNHANFSDVHVVDAGTNAVDEWHLTEGGDGLREVHIRVTDVAGNRQTGSDSIRVWHPKQVGTVNINDGEELTGQSVVRLSVEVPPEAGFQLMQVSNEPTFSDAEWEVLEEEIMWILSEGDGERTVHVRFKDFRKVVSIPITDTIVLDQTPPVLNVTLNDGNLYTTEVRVAGTLAYEDASDPVRMWVSLDEDFDQVKPGEFSGSFELVIPDRESDHTVYVRVEDAAGNVGAGNDTVHFATIRPHIDLELPLGEVIQTVPRVPVKVTPVDPYGGIHVQAAFDDRPAENAPWMPLSGLVHVDVPGDVMDGVHTIWVRARNAAGLTTEDAVPIEVTFDNLAPSLAILRPEDGSKMTQRGLEVMLEVDVHDSSKLSRFVYVVDGGDPLNLTTRVPWTNVTLEEWGEHTIEVIVEDEAGNTATSTSVFTMVDESKISTGTNTGLLLIVLLAIVGAAIVVAYTYNRRFMPGLRSTAVHDGDGFEEEWDHPELVTLEEERRPSELPVHPEDPVYRAREARKNGAAAPGPGDLEGTELEQVEMPDLESVDLPEELGASKGDASKGDASKGDASEWDEF